MADNRQELKGVNWNEVFSFSHVFKSFRMAIHLSKLVLALAAIVVIFAVGWCMDRVWTMGGAYAQVDEISSYFVLPSNAFASQKDNRLEKRDELAAKLRADSYKERYLLQEYKKILGQEIKVNELRGPRKSYFLEAVDAKLEEDEKALRREGKWEPKDPSEYKDDPWSQSKREARDLFSKEVVQIENVIAKGYENAEKTIDKGQDELTSDKDKDKARKKLQKDHEAALRSLTERKKSFNGAVESICGRPIFASLCEYETGCLSNAMAAVWRGDISPGMDVYQNIVCAKAGQVLPPSAAVAMPAPNGAGFVFWTLAAAHGMKWFICQHWFYALAFLLVSLAAWALFGGAVHRMAALQAAREEKISISQALKFSASKFLSFFFAPLLPVVGILGVGALLIVGGLLGNIMGFGAILVGALFVLAIVLGLFIAFVAVGLIAGVGLMYPTIAVEGSDALDAISRSFSYVFTKPWRAVVYGVVAVVYGAICYLFVRFFAYMALAGAHFFAKIGIWTGGQTLREGADKLDVMWTAPTFSVFSGPANLEAMSTAEQVGSFLISVWVYLVIGVVLAFVLSYCASVTTVIYYLLRRKVDATDLDDVYVEEAQEEIPASEQPAVAAEAPPEGGEKPSAGQKPAE
jgi:hypothetical protein